MSSITIVVYVAVMAGVIVGVDVAFLKNQFWARLIVNVGIVAAFGGLYLAFLRHR